MEIKLSKVPTMEESYWFSQYEKVRKQGRFNMVTDSLQAIEETGLSDDQYWFVLENYEELSRRYSDC